MGEQGLSRACCRPVRSAWTYAGSLASVGQLTPEALLDDVPLPSARTGRRRSTVVVGSPVAHSVSPAMHNAAFRAAAIDAVYLPLPAADVDDFVTFARALRSEGRQRHDSVQGRAVRSRRRGRMPSRAGSARSTRSGIDDGALDRRQHRRRRVSAAAARSRRAARRGMRAAILGARRRGAGGGDWRWRRRGADGHACTRADARRAQDAARACRACRPDRGRRRRAPGTCSSTARRSACTRTSTQSPVPAERADRALRLRPRLQPADDAAAARRGGSRLPDDRRARHAGRAGAGAVLSGGPERRPPAGRDARGGAERRLAEFSDR